MTTIGFRFILASPEESTMLLCSGSSSSRIFLVHNRANLRSTMASELKKKDHFQFIGIGISPHFFNFGKRVGLQVTSVLGRESLSVSKSVDKNPKKSIGKKEHHLWKKRDSAGSGQKALYLVKTVSELPNEKEAVYRALDKWTAWEVEFPVIAAAKALNILKKRRQWLRVIQVAKWMLSKGQGATMATYDTLLLAFDMEKRVDEAESLWNMILHAHTRFISKRLFSRLISLYAHHNMEDKIIEVFADMEELRVRPDEDTTRRVAWAFKKLGQEEKQQLVLRRYLSEWKYIHFNGERARVRRYEPDSG